MSNCLFLGTLDDRPYLPYLKGMFNGLSTYVVTEPLDYLTLLESYCDKRQITRIVSTNTNILSKLLERIGNIKSNPSLSDYQGSLFSFGARNHIEIVFVSPLKQLFTVSYGKFIAQRFISKVTSPVEWREPTAFNWQVLTASNIEAFYHEAQTSLAIAVDIETFKSPLSIRCIGYTCVLRSATGGIHTISGVLPLDSLWALAWMRKLNDTEPAKILQNGKYDNTYLLRYNAPLRNWVWDTAHQFHSYYSELPKDLAFLNAFFLRKVVYWKDLAETNDLYEYYKYNALDTWATANVWIGWILEAPDWARKNYTLEFPLVFPCLLSEMTGIKRDAEAHIKARNQVDSQEEKALINLRTMVGAPGFNPASPLQVKSLLKVLGCSDIESSDEKSLSKASYRHPLIGRISEAFVNYAALICVQMMMLNKQVFMQEKAVQKNSMAGGFTLLIRTEQTPDGWLVKAMLSGAGSPFKPFLGDQKLSKHYELGMVGTSVNAILNKLSPEILRTLPVIPHLYVPSQEPQTSILLTQARFLACLMQISTMTALAKLKIRSYVMLQNESITELTTTWVPQS
jgi:hypothetical protein